MPHCAIYHIVSHINMLVPNYNMCVKACCFVQLTEVERTRSMLEVDNNSLKRRLAAMSADTIQVKEEVCTLSLFYLLTYNTILISCITLLFSDNTALISCTFCFTSVDILSYKLIALFKIIDLKNDNKVLKSSDMQKLDFITLHYFKTTIHAC